MTYTQITLAERYAIWALRKQGLKPAAIARELGRHRSTVTREIRRNIWRENRVSYFPLKAQSYTNQRRRMARRGTHFSSEEWAFVEDLLREDWSPEQVAGWCARFGILAISHETIYRYIWTDRGRGGTLWLHLRAMTKPYRKRYAAYDSRGRLAGKRHISERPAAAERRSRIGHWEGDTVMGSPRDTACILTLVERRSGFVAIGQLDSRQAANVAARLQQLIESATGTTCYCATPRHSWERGSNENANGLIRQISKKGVSMAQLTQTECQRIADKLNRRPRKRFGFRTPEEVYAG